MPVVDDQIGEYKIIKNDNTMQFEAVKDKCKERVESLKGVVFTKKK